MTSRSCGVGLQACYAGVLAGILRSVWGRMLSCGPIVQSAHVANGRAAFFATLALLTTFPLHAETGRDAWLRYAPPPARKSSVESAA